MNFMTKSAFVEFSIMKMDLLIVSRELGYGYKHNGDNTYNSKHFLCVKNFICITAFRYYLPCFEAKSCCKHLATTCGWKMITTHRRKKCNK